jgi:Methyltransferase domain
MMALGFGMNGMEERILDVARDVAAQFNEVTYVEIGVGEGTTLTAIASVLSKAGIKWRAIGIDLPNGYSFSETQTKQIADTRVLKLEFVTPNSAIVHPAWNQVTVYLKDSQSFLTEHWQEPIHFAMIDGCHGKPCVTLDFLALEAFMVKGATMMFHDFSKDQVGQPQPHCPDGVDVRGACYDLGLLTGKRQGWTFGGEIFADRSNGGWDMGVFKKEK